jgi:hypothetical protein
LIFSFRRDRLLLRRGQAQLLPSVKQSIPALPLRVVVVLLRLSEDRPPPVLPPQAALVQQVPLELVSFQRLPPQVARALLRLSAVASALL